MFSNNSNKYRRRGEQRDKNQQRPSRPHGLRGAEIGLYYKNLYKKKKRERTINLNIPSCVVNALDRNLAAIAKIADNHNISFPQTIKRTNSFKNNLNINAIIKHEITNKQKPDKATEKNKSIEIKKEHDDKYEIDCKAGPSSAPNFVPISNNVIFTSEPRLLSLRGMADFKYGYKDIITGTFEEKLDECLLKGNINIKNTDTENLNAALYEEYKDMIQHKNYKKMLEFRKILPAYVKAQDIIDVIENNPVVVISGETGCGKSTQVPQIILDNAICNNKGANVKIVVTQPRRIAASSLAMRVSKERAESLGNSVGYVVRLEKVEARPRGCIQYCTTGILLADLEVNQGLTEYSHVILDEVHERDTSVDLTMCMLKQVLKKRKDLKLILMSATLDAESLSAYFDNCPVMHIEGLAYPVQDVYLEDILTMTGFQLTESNRKQRRPQPKWMKYTKRVNNEDIKDIQYKAEISRWLESKKIDLDYDVYKTLQDSQIEELNFNLIVELLIHICKDKPGAILVFLPGIGEITKLMRLMDESKRFPPSYFEIYPLHSKLATLEQHRIFERPREPIRKIIIATNIAETSITIDDIVYVVDCAKIKINGLNVEQNISTLQIQWVSQANLHQRRGRAGRCQPGVCYHLLTSYRAGKLEERLLPELQRSNLLEAVLMIKRLRLGLAEDALKNAPSPPAPSTVQAAVRHLQKCGALNDDEVLTPLGWHLARLPVHPSAGKLLLLGALFGCLDRAASVAAVWGFKDPFQLVIGKENEVYKSKRNFALGEPSDHVTVSEAIIKWENCSQRQKQSFAYDNFLSHNTLELLSDMKRQFGDHLRQMGFLPSGDVKGDWENRNSNNLCLFKAIVAGSLYPNIATVRWLGRNKGSRIISYCPDDGRVEIHPSSIMAGPKTSRDAPKNRDQTALCHSPGANWLVYWLKQKSSNLFFLDVTLIYTLPLIFFGEFVISEDTENPSYCLLSISSIKIRCKRDNANKLFQLRCLLDQVLASVVMVNSDYSTQNNEFDKCVLNSVKQLITAEDEQVEYFDDDASDNDTSFGSQRTY